MSDSRVRRQVERALSFRERLELAEEGKKRIEALRLGRAVALAGLPKRPTKERDVGRLLRLGQDMWLNVIYSAGPGNQLPFGEDRFVLAGVQHLAITNDDPVVTFERAGQLLKMFGLHEGGKDIKRLRERFKRLAGLSIHLHYGRSEEEALDGSTGQQTFVIEQWALPTRADIRKERAGQEQLLDALYGVRLSATFWDFLKQDGNRLLVPIELLKMFVDNPTGWDYTVFLVHRCGAAKTTSVVPHEALMALFKDHPEQEDRKVVARLKKIHEQLMVATEGRLRAEWLEETVATPGRGRSKKRWSLRVGPSKSVLGGKMLRLTSNQP